jgi:hypothetical protein
LISMAVLVSVSFCGCFTVSGITIFLFAALIPRVFGCYKLVSLTWLSLCHLPLFQEFSVALSWHYIHGSASVISPYSNSFQLLYVGITFMIQPLSFSSTKAAIFHVSGTPLSQGVNHYFFVVNFFSVTYSSSFITLSKYIICIVPCTLFSSTTKTI